MWKKIHSNRDPRDTLYREIRKEFAAGFTSIELAAGRLFRAYPKLLFGGMIFLLVLSAALSFTVFRTPDKAIASASLPAGTVTNGFNEIIQATGTIRETIRLKHIVDSLSAKRQLSAADSLMLGTALDRLSGIHPKHK